MRLAALLLLVSAAALADVNPDERFTAAQLALRDGDVTAALETLEPLQQDYPDNVDYVFAYGIALSRQGRDDEALDQLGHATELAPGYEDVWRMRYSILARQQDLAALDEFRQRSAEQFPDATWWHAPEPEPRHPWLLTVGAGFDSLDNDLPNWDNQFVELGWERTESQRYAVSVARDSRNDNSDTSAGLAAEWSRDRWIAGGAFTSASSPDVMPETSVDLYAGRSFTDGWAATLRYRNRAYTNATVSSVIVTAEKYVSDFRFAYDLGSSRLHGASSFLNHVIVGSWFYREDSSVGLTFSTGREAEAIGGGQVLETDVTGVSLNGRHQFTERVGLQWWLGIHDQGDLYRRQFLGMAVSIRI